MKILGRLKKTRGTLGVGFIAESLPQVPKQEWDTDEKSARLKSCMESVQTEVHPCTDRGFGRTLRNVSEEKKLKRLLYGPNTGLDKKLKSMKRRTPKSIPDLVPYDKPIEKCKQTLFSIDAGITTTLGGIAETGSLILWPTQNEPRLLSLIPPIHLAVLYASEIHSTFSEAMRKGSWSSGMPTNALLVSGPSKTADIEQTLVYGVHGPKELVVFLISDA